VDWDAQSFLSLQQYISKMNLVIPEWILHRPDGGYGIHQYRRAGLDGDEKFRGEGDAHPVEQLQGRIPGRCRSPDHQ